MAIYVKNSLICKERHDLSIPQLEAVWIETKIGQDKLLIGSFYRPPNSKSDYWDLIDQSIKNVSSTPHKFIMHGDFNKNFLSNPSPRLLDVINFNNLQQVVTHPTRITETSATLIYLVLTSCTDLTYAIRKRKLYYLQDLDNRASSSATFGTKNWWKLVKSFISNKGSDPDVIPPLEKYGVTYYTNKEKATILNQFFINNQLLKTAMMFQMYQNY